MNKQQIFDALGGKFSKTGIIEVDGEYRLVGKFCHISPPDDPSGLWDIWICNAKAIKEGLTTRKINNIYARLPVKWQVRELNGEGYTQVPLKSLNAHLTRLAKPLGLRLKRQLSAEQIAISSERLANIRKGL